MTAMHRKLLRDLWHAKGQALAIALVLSCGVAMLVMSLTTLHSLTATIDRYYNEYRFAHIWAYLERAPKTLLPRVAEIPGVSHVQTRVVADVNLDLEDMPEPAIGRLISIPDRQQPMLNDLHIRQGRWIEPGRRGEVLVSHAFAEAHQLRSGDTVRAIINGRLRTLTIVGVALSPEYIYEIREGDLLPDNKRFGVFWMGETELAAAFDLEGSFNSITLSTLPGANREEIIARLDRLTERYGGLGAFERSEQTSHRLISGELEQLRAMAVITPVIFFAVALFLLNMALSRIVGTQREQIAALKAFGYSRWEIGLHYLQFVLIIATVGSIIGVALGAWFGRALTLFYAHFFRFPWHEYHLDWRVVVPTIAVGLAVASIGAVAAVRRAVMLPPAEAMRPEPPPEFRPTIIERIGIQSFLSQTARMVLRTLERRPLRAAMTTLGIAFAASVMILGSFSSDIVDYLIDYEFHRSQRQDVTVTFFDSTAGRAERELANMPGVLHAEGFRAIPARLRFEQRSERVGIMGVPSGSSLMHLMDDQERRIVLPNDGLVVSDKLADLLRISVGDVVTIEVLERERPERQVPVAAVVRQYTGQGAWMDRQAAQRLMREQDRISGAHLAVDSDQLTALYAALKETPGVSGVTIKRAAVDSFMETYAEIVLTMRLFNIIFGSIIAIGVVYNAARITFAERSHELATLRVIGFSRGEVSAILFGELTVLTLIAIPVGLFIGYWFSVLAVLAMDTEDLRMPMVIEPATYATAAATVLVATIASVLFVRRGIDRLDLVAVLKTGT
ncbi:MAG: ABC transporter permease [Phycisphaerales bacterium]|nr:MAG: ABC transporter permease [Phycisphaerales bacterium]